jgi:hypothetical protein
MWKFLGAAAWHSALFAAASAAWHLAAAPGSPLPWRLLSLSGLAAAATLYATSLAVLWAQRRLLAPRDVPPVHAPRLGLTSRTWGGLLLARCVLRARTPASALDAAALYAAAAASGALGVAALVAPSAGGQGRGGAWEGARRSGRRRQLDSAAALPGARPPPWQFRPPCAASPAPIPSCTPPLPSLPFHSGKAGTQWLLAYGATLGLLYAVVYLVRCARGPLGRRRDPGRAAGVCRSLPAVAGGRTRGRAAAGRRPRPPRALLPPHAPLPPRPCSLAPPPPMPPQGQERAVLPHRAAAALLPGQAAVESG